MSISATIPVPAGWEMTTLEDVCVKITDGSHSPPKKQAAGKPMLSATNVAGNRVVLSDHRLIDEEDFERENRRTKVSVGDVLLTIVGTIGRTAVVPQGLPPITLQRSVAVIKPCEVDPHFIMHQLQSPKTAAYLQDNAKGTAQRGIYLKTLANTPFLLPPLNEQRRIVDRIEVLFAKLEKGEEALRAVQKQLARYRQSVLKAAVTGQLTGGNPAMWKPITLGELLEDIRYGTAKKCHPRADGVAVLRIPNVANGKIDLQDLKYTQLDVREIRTLALKKGDLLIVRSNGSANLVGRGAVVNDDAAGLAFAGYLIRLRVDQRRLLPDFLQLVLSSPVVRASIERQARSTSGVHNVNSGEVKAIAFDLPPVDVQSEIVELVDEHMAKIGDLDAWCRTELTRSIALRRSILRDAFSGRLVSQDPNDEPAAALLARIRRTNSSSSKLTGGAAHE